MLSKMDRMQPGEHAPVRAGQCKSALAAFRSVTGKAAVKHMIIISDGVHTPPNNGTVTAFRQAGIVVSTVAIGAHGPAGSTPLKDIAAKTGGKYYVVTNPKAAADDLQQGSPPDCAASLIYEKQRRPSKSKWDRSRTRCSTGSRGDLLHEIQGFVLTHTQGKSARRSAGRLRKAGQMGSQQYHPGKLDSQSRPNRGVYHRCRAAVGDYLARVAAATASFSRR